MTKTKAFPLVLNELKRSKFVRDNSGALMSVIIWMIVAFIAATFFALWFFAHNTVTNQLIGVGNDGITNISTAASDTFGQINNVMSDGLALLSLVLIFGQALSILIVSYFQRSNPVFFVLHVMITLLAVVLAVVISNAYETITLDPTIGSTLLSFRGAAFIMFNLPLWVTVIGLVGAVLMFVGQLRTTNAGGV